MTMKWMPELLLVALVTMGTEAASVRISSVEELAAYAVKSGNKVRMKPGVYCVDCVHSEDPKTVFHFSGSKNRFDFTGVTLQIDTKVLASMPRGQAHEHATYRIDGDRIEFIGGTFEDVGDHAPTRGVVDFQVSGDDAVFKGCRFIVRGSSPYGYGDYYGKGRGAAVGLRKHSGMAILGDDALVEACYFQINTFGHGIHIHGAQDTVIRDVNMEGRLRLTDEIYAETSGPAARYDYKIMFPPWKKGQSIPKGEMLSLTEDGIRAYLEGKDLEGNQRRTGHITVENCTVIRMRTGIALCHAGGAEVTDCTVIDCGGAAYALPSNGIVRDCRGNAAYSPLLSLPYSHHRNADIQLELIESSSGMGNHPLAAITGNGHTIKIIYRGHASPKTLRPIILGTSQGRHTEENSDPDRVREKNAAIEISLNNRTPHPVYLTQYASDNDVSSRGNVTKNVPLNRTY